MRLITEEFSKKNINLYTKNPMMDDKYNKTIMKPDNECT